MNFLIRLRIFIGGELASLSGWVLPRFNDDDDLPCGELAKWAIYYDDPYEISYSCTIHLSDMASATTKTILPNHTSETCKYCYSIPEEETT